MHRSDINKRIGPSLQAREQRKHGIILLISLQDKKTDRDGHEDMSREPFELCATDTALKLLIQAWQSARMSTNDIFTGRKITVSSGIVWC